MRMHTGPLIRLTVTVDPPPQLLAADWDAMIRRMQDLSPVLNTLPEEVIFPAVEQLFATEGFGQWSFKGWQSTPPMIKTGLMKRGLTHRDQLLNTITVTKDTLTFALNPGPYIAASRAHTKRKSGGVFYPGIHHHGGTRHNRNPVLALTDEDIQKATQKIIDYILTGEL